MLDKYKIGVVDLLKIDIEGAERFIFEDDALVAAFLGRTRFIVIEIHDEFNVRERICRCLAVNGFEYFDVGELTIGENRNLVPVGEGLSR